MAGSIHKDSSTKKDASGVVWCVILTVVAIIATYPAPSFLLQYYDDVVGTSFVLAAVLWGLAAYRWSKILKHKSSNYEA
jgi:hypothetical protein